MKVLFVTPAWEPAYHLGGIVQSQSLLCRALSALGVDVTVYTTDSGGNRRLNVPLNQPVCVNGVRVFYFRTDWSLRYFYSTALAKACRDTLREYDLLHVVSFWCYPGLVACREARRQGVPYILAPHGTLIPYCLRQKSFRKLLYLKAVEYPNLQHATAIRYTTEIEREQCAYLRLATPSFVVPNGIDCTEFDRLPFEEEAMKRLGLPPGRHVVAYLGRLHSRKGLDILVLAFRQVIEQFPDGLLVLAGPDDGYAASLRNLVRKLGLDNHVLFTGFLSKERRLDLFSVAKLVALASYPGDNFGMAVAEAMAAGVPVLISEHVGISREVKIDGAGVVVPVERDAIARELMQLLSSRDSLEEMGRKAYVSARKRYDVCTVAQQMLLAYKDVLTGRRSPGLGWSDAR
jgi:glycosyltransferase involved in cell wall biosynthesis